MYVWLTFQHQQRICYEICWTLVRYHTTTVQFNNATTQKSSLKDPISAYSARECNHSAEIFNLPQLINWYRISDFSNYLKKDIFKFFSVKKILRIIRIKSIISMSKDKHDKPRKWLSSKSLKMVLIISNLV